jgi:uncharacterized membrane protein
MVSELRIEIDRPLSEVYAAFNDPDNLPRWITGLQRTEPISGTPGQVGARTRQIYLERGRTVELIEVITAHEPMKRFAGEIEGQGVNCAIRVEFVDRGRSTLVVASCDVTSRSFMLGLMLPLVKRSIRKRQSDDFERFKRLLEAGELRAGRCP